MVSDLRKSRDSRLEKELAFIFILSVKVRDFSRETSETSLVMVICVNLEIITKRTSYCISAISSVFTPITAILMDCQSIF